jgi:drug/metabolite transporter (DMT)-like permease
MRKSLDVEAPVTPEGRHHLSLGSLALVLFAVIAASGGQLMLKHGMQVATARAHSSHGSLVVAAAPPPGGLRGLGAAAAPTPWVLLGLVVFGVSAVAWLGALSKVPLSMAYPFNALGYLVILTTSILVLHERANLVTWAGTVLVVSGLVMVVLSKP